MEQDADAVEVALADFVESILEVVCRQSGDEGGRLRLSLE